MFNISSPTALREALRPVAKCLKGIYTSDAGKKGAFELHLQGEAEPQKRSWRWRLMKRRGCLLRGPPPAEIMGPPSSLLPDGPWLLWLRHTEKGHLGHSVEVRIAKTGNKGKSQGKEPSENGLFPVRRQRDGQSSLSAGELSPPLHVALPLPLVFKFKTLVLFLTLHASSPTCHRDCGG